MLCQARYSMGNARVSRLQYNDADLSCALVHVAVCPPSDSESSYRFHPHIDIPHPNRAKTTEIDSHADETGSSENESEPTDPAADFPSGLRKRNVFSRDSTANSDSHDDESSLVDDMKTLAVGKEKPKKNDSGGKYSTPQDPLHWFGILIPISLRQSQTAFRRSIDTVCEIASLQTQLLDIHNQYQTALKTKRRLSASSTIVEDS